MLYFLVFPAHIDSFRVGINLFDKVGVLRDGHWMVLVVFVGFASEGRDCKCPGNIYAVS